jgi:hypothetical protein
LEEEKARLEALFEAHVKSGRCLFRHRRAFASTSENTGDNIANTHNARSSNDFGFEHHDVEFFAPPRRLTYLTEKDLMAPGACTDDFNEKHSSQTVQNPPRWCTQVGTTSSVVSPSQHSATGTYLNSPSRQESKTSLPSFDSCWHEASWNFFTSPAAAAAVASCDLEQQQQHGGGGIVSTAGGDLGQNARPDELFGTGAAERRHSAQQQQECDSIADIFQILT